MTTNHLTACITCGLSASTCSTLGVDDGGMCCSDCNHTERIRVRGTGVQVGGQTTTTGGDCETFDNGHVVWAAATDALECPHCDVQHQWPCPTIPRCDEPGCDQEATCGWPTTPGGTVPNGGYRRTCGDHMRAFERPGAES